MPEKILVADHEPSVCQIEHLLREAGYDVVLATDGDAALKLAKTEQPDLCIINRQLAGVHGVEVVRRLLLDSATHHIPVIMTADMLSYADSKDFLEEMGGKGYIPKPLDPDRLRRAVRNALHACKPTQ